MAHEGMETGVYYLSCEIVTVLEASRGSFWMTGSKTFSAQMVWHTTEHSTGVMLMFKKPCLLSMLKPSIPSP